MLRAATRGSLTRAVALPPAQIEVKSAEEIFEVLARSMKKRVTHETQMNKHSSRSHAIFTIQIATTVVDAEGNAVKKVGRLNLVDLSGSENLKRSGSSGDRQREASHINQGLLSLGRVIKGITDKAKYIPCVGRMRAVQAAQLRCRPTLTEACCPGIETASSRGCWRRAWAATR